MAPPGARSRVPLSRRAADVATWCRRPEYRMVASGPSDRSRRDSWSPWTAPGRSALDQVIQTEASIISHVDDFKLMMILSLAPSPCTLAAACRVGGKERRCDGHGVITHFGAQRPLGQSARRKEAQMNKFLLALAFAREPIDGNLCPAPWHRPGREGLPSRCQAVLPQVDGSMRFFCTCLAEGKSYQATSGLRLA
jgi:hypothetical protein